MLAVNCFGNLLSFLRCGYNSAPHHAGLVVNCQQVHGKTKKPKPWTPTPPCCSHITSEISLLTWLHVLEVISASFWLPPFASHLLASRNWHQQCKVEVVLMCRRTQTPGPVHHWTFALSDPAGSGVCLSVRPVVGWETRLGAVVVWKSGLQSEICIQRRLGKVSYWLGETNNRPCICIYFLT